MIQSLRLQNYRSYSDASFEFEPGVNIIVGPNASGKTNLLEAVLLLSGLRSYRAKDAELVRIDSEWGRLDAQINSEQRTIKLQAELSESIKRTLIIGDKVIKRARLEHVVPTVLFEPNNLLLLYATPSYRRDFIDALLEQTLPNFRRIRNYYKRALAQRNALLKQPSPTPDQLFVWNVRLSELGGVIVKARNELIDFFNTRLSELYSEIAHQPSRVTMKYQSTPHLEDDYSTVLLRQLEKSAARDSQTGFTSHGPHRDDIAFALNAQTAGATASRGETRTLLLAIKIAELERLEAIRGTKPILLLDDVFSELDAARRRFLVEYLEKTQTIITTTDADAVINYFTKNHNLIAL